MVNNDALNLLQADAPVAQQADPHPSITSPELPESPQESAEDSFLGEACKVKLAAQPTNLTIPDTVSALESRLQSALYVTMFNAWLCIYAWMPGCVYIVKLKRAALLRFYLYCPADIFVSYLVLLCLSSHLLWFLQGYIDKCESWLAEAVQGSANPKSVAVHIMVLAHFWEYQVLRLPASDTESWTASLQRISKMQFRIRGLAKRLQHLLPPSWMPAVVSLHKTHLPQCA